MKKYKYLLISSLFLSTLSYGQINMGKLKVPKTIPGTTAAKGTGLSESEIIDGLKEALTKGATIASSQLNQTNGFWGNSLIKIPFPEDCKLVAKKLRELGYGNKVDEFELTLNRAAEQAAKEAAPIFVNAVKQMSVADGKNILFGADTAATHYLRNSTYSSLFSAFSPHVNTALDKTTATSKWTELTKIYNKIPTVKKVDTDLSRYTTNKALNGLFVVVSEEEKKIRKDPGAQTSDLLRKVFGQQ